MSDTVCKIKGCGGYLTISDPCYITSAHGRDPSLSVTLKVTPGDWLIRAASNRENNVICANSLTERRPSHTKTNFGQLPCDAAQYAFIWHDEPELHAEYQNDAWWSDAREAVRTLEGHGNEFMEMPNGFIIGTLHGDGVYPVTWFEDKDRTTGQVFMNLGRAYI